MSQPRQVKHEIGDLTYLIAVPVGWLKAKASLMGGTRDIEVIPQDGV
jgi:hypothetical protein